MERDDKDITFYVDILKTTGSRLSGSTTEVHMHVSMHVSWFKDTPNIDKWLVCADYPAVMILFKRLRKDSVFY